MYFVSAYRPSFQEKLVGYAYPIFARYSAIEVYRIVENPIDSIGVMAIYSPIELMFYIVNLSTSLRDDNRVNCQVLRR